MCCLSQDLDGSILSQVKHFIAWYALRSPRLIFSVHVINLSALIYAKAPSRPELIGDVKYLLLYSDKPGHQPAILCVNMGRLDNITGNPEMGYPHHGCFIRYSLFSRLGHVPTP